jgi:arsenate reductase (thioredoxin)
MTCKERGTNGERFRSPSMIWRALFVCIGNSCRSPMAEGFANYYGKGWISAYSAGSHPAGFLMPLTLQVMQEKGIDISHQTSKGLTEVSLKDMDSIVILDSSLAHLGGSLPQRANKLFWILPDPVGKPVEVYRTVRDEIELRVLDFIEAIRKET